MPAPAQTLAGAFTASTADRARGGLPGAVHASIIFVFEIGDPAGASTVALFLNKKSIVNSNSLRGNIHTLR